MGTGSKGHRAQRVLGMACLPLDASSCCELFKTVGESTVQEGRDPMREKEFVTSMGGLTACALRVCIGTVTKA